MKQQQTYTRGTLVMYGSCPAIVCNSRENRFYSLTWLEEMTPTSGGEQTTADFKLATAAQIAANKAGFDKLTRMYGK